MKKEETRYKQRRQGFDRMLKDMVEINQNKYYVDLAILMILIGMFVRMVWP